MNQNDKILHLATLTGYYVLCCGGETYRVEDTICRILLNYKMENVNAFTSPTVVIASCMYEGKTYTKVLRVNNRSADMDMMDKLNQLSRDSKDIDIDEFEKRLNEIIISENKDDIKSVLYAGLVALGFTLFFKGSIIDAVYSFLLGVVVKVIIILLKKKEINNFMVTLISSFLITIFSLYLEDNNLIASKDIVIIGTIMLLVPGLAITNAIKDFLSNDLVSGTTRAMEAFVIAVFVAVGSGLALAIWIKLGGLI